VVNMKAVVIQEYGSADVLQIIDDFPKPKVGDNQALIQVHAAGVNPLDWKIRRGDLKFLLRSPFPLVLGNDVSGIVVQAGSAVRDFQPGDEVYAMVDGNSAPVRSGFAKCGAYAEFAVTRADTLAPKPPTLTHEEAASVPLAALTAWQALRQKAHIQPGQSILINGASGGVGIFAVQMAKKLGAAVTAVCSEANAGLVTNLGAGRVVDYRKFAVTELKQPFDIVYDVVAATSFAQCKHLLKKGGVFVTNIPSFGVMLSAATFPLRRFFGARKKQVAAWVRPVGKDLAEISALIAAGKLRTVIDTVYPLEEIRKAHAYSQSGRVKGKLVLKVV
jgi:NADPH:quinone reductase-like Zn-dependent oxidoreductase